MGRSGKKLQYLRQLFFGGPNSVKKSSSAIWTDFDEIAPRSRISFCSCVFPVLERIWFRGESSVRFQNFSVGTVTLDTSFRILTTACLPSSVPKALFLAKRPTVGGFFDGATPR